MNDVGEEGVAILFSLAMWGSNRVLERAAG